VGEALSDVLPCVDLLLAQLVRSGSFDLPEHSVEGGDEPPRLVARLYDEPHAEIARSDAPRRLLEAHEGLGDEVGRGAAEEEGDEKEGQYEEAIQKDEEVRPLGREWREEIRRTRGFAERGGRAVEPLGMRRLKTR